MLNVYQKELDEFVKSNKCVTEWLSEIIEIFLRRVFEEKNTLILSCLLASVGKKQQIITL